MIGDSKPVRLLPWILIRVLPPAALVFGIFGCLAFVFTESRFRENFSAQLDHELEHHVATLTTHIDRFKESAQAIAGNSLIVNSLVDVEAREEYLPIFFSRLQIAGLQDGEIVFTDHKGRPIASSLPDARPLRIEDYKTVLQGEDYLRIDADGLEFGFPVIYNGNVEGMIVGRYGPEQTARLLSLRSSVYATIVNIGDAILYSSDDQFASIFRNEAERPDWLERQAQVRGHGNVNVIIAAPRDAVFSVFGKIQWIIPMWGIISLLGLTLGIFIAMLLISRPLKSLMDQVGSFGGAQDLGRKMEPSGFSEIHELASCFNLMLRRLQRAVVSQAELESEIRNRKLFASRLRDRDERTRAILENVLEGVITIDETGAIETFNAAASKIFGYEPDLVAGENVRILMPNPDRNKHDGYLRSFKETGEQKMDVASEVTGLRRNGETFPMELAVSPMTVGGRLMFTGVVRDITERKRIETEQNEFVSIVSHELRTPLTALVGSLGLVEQGVLGTIPPKAGDLITLALSNARRLASLVNDILDIQKIESGKMEYSLEDVDMIEVAHLVLAEMEPYSKKYGTSLRLESTLQQAMVRADRIRIIQIFSNLLSNAAKFSPEGEVVVLSVEDNGNAFRFSVVDKGPGVPEEMKEKIFKKFTQIDASDARSHEGTGLGLGIAGSIVEAHGGKIAIESQPGHGSTFYFELQKCQPLADDHSDRGDAPVGPHPAEAAIDAGTG